MIDECLGSWARPLCTNAVQRQLPRCCCLLASALQDASSAIPFCRALLIPISVLVFSRPFDATCVAHETGLIREWSY